MGIPEQARLSPRPLAARNLPGFTLLPGGVDELVAFLPAHDKAHPAPPETPEPGTGAISSIEDVAHLSPPPLRRLAQQGLLLVPLLPTDSLLSTPPAHSYDLGHAAFADQQQAFPFKPSHTHRNAWPIEHPWSAASQPAHPTGTYGAQSVQRDAFRLLQDAAVPNAQRRFSSLFHLLSTLL